MADPLDSSNILAKIEIEETKGIKNFLEYRAIKHGISKFLQNASKKRIDIEPYRPEMLNLYRKIGQYGNEI